MRTCASNLCSTAPCEALSCVLPFLLVLLSSSCATASLICDMRTAAVREMGLFVPVY